MSLIFPDGSRTVTYGLGNQSKLAQPQNPFQFTPRQTNASYNYTAAQAAQQADPRAAAKSYQRAGLSSSKGTAALGAIDAANQYAAGMSQAEMGRMQDAYANAGIGLADQVERDRFSNALLGLQDQANQQQWMNNYQNMQNATGFMKNVFGGFGGGGSSLLSGLL